MADFIFKISPNIVLGSYTVNRLGQYVGEWGEKYLVVADPILKESGVTKKVTDALAERNIDSFVFDEISGVADTETLSSILNLARGSKVHGIIAVGGGKILSLAKAACAIFYGDKTVYDYIDGSLNPPQKMLPLVCVPTTSRDSIIFTDRVILSDSRSSKAKLIKSQNGLCRLILWDPQLQNALTEKQIACMILESLSFAVEGYISSKSNFFSDMIVEKSVHLLKCAMDGNSAAYTTVPQEVLVTQGGCMASLGASSSSFGACHLLSVVINSRYKIFRSIVSSILLPYIIEDAASFKADRLSILAKILDVYKEENSPAENCQALANYVRQKIAKANIPSRLKDLSLSIEQLSLAVEDAGDLDFINSLQRSMTTDDLFEIVKKAY